MSQAGAGIKSYRDAQISFSELRGSWCSSTGAFGIVVLVAQNRRREINLIGARSFSAIASGIER